MAEQFLMNDDEQLGTILCVDDESAILNVLQDTLETEPLEVLTASKGSEALEILKNKQVDLILCDINMPEMDGFTLLNEVKRKHPTIIRCMLSGMVEESAAVKALTEGLVTTYFQKPWDITELKEGISRILKLNKTIKNEKMVNLMDSLDKLPSLPMLYQYFMNAFSRGANFEEFADIIKKDVTVVTKILHISNSAFFRGMGEPNASIEHAIMTMGLNAVKNVILAVTLANQKPLTSEQQEYFQAIIDHSSIVNKYMQVLYKSKYQKNMPSKINSLGITHDIGKIVLLQYFPERFEKIIAYQKQYPNHSFYDCELALGYAEHTHAEVGAFLLNLWNLPTISIEVALYHHIYTNQPSEHNDILLISRFANDLVNMCNRVDDVLEIDFSEFEYLGIPEEELDEIAADIKKDLLEFETTRFMV